MIYGILGGDTNLYGDIPSGSPKQIEDTLNLGSAWWLSIKGMGLVMSIEKPK